MLITPPTIIGQDEVVFISPEFSYIVGSDGWDYLLYNEMDSEGNYYSSGYFNYPVFDLGIRGPGNFYPGPYYDLNKDVFQEYPVVGYEYHYSGFHEIPLTKFDSQGNIVSSRYFGGNGDDKGNGLFLTKNENIILIGESTSSSFHDPNLNITNNGLQDGIFIELSNSGEVVYGTNFGGSSYDRIIDAVEGSDGSYYLLGTSSSPDFPLVNPVDSDLHNETNSDLLLIKLRSNHTVEFSTFFGGSDVEFAASIALDSQDNIYITGFSFSDDFPIQNSVSSFKGKTDGVIAKFSRNGTLIKSSYLGGTLTDVITDIEIFNNTLYLSGQTGSPDFPIFLGTKVLDSELNDNGESTTTDGFYVIGDLDLNFEISSYIGGGLSDSIRSLTVDNEGYVYLTGNTNSATYPIHGNFTRPPPFNGLILDEAKEATPNRDLVITKLSPEGEIMYSVFYGGFLDDFSYDIHHHRTNGTDFVFLSGYTSSGDFPTSERIQSGRSLANSFAIQFTIPEGFYNRVLYPGPDNSQRQRIIVGLILFALLSSVGLFVYRYRRAKRERLQHDNYMNSYDIIREAMKEE